MLGLILAIGFPKQVISSGAITGLTYGVMAVGVVLIFRSTRVINFAIGEMGGFAAALLYRMVIDWDVPFWLSFAIGIGVGRDHRRRPRAAHRAAAVLGATRDPARRAHRRGPGPALLPADPP